MNSIHIDHVHQFGEVLFAGQGQCFGDQRRIRIQIGEQRAKSIGKVRGQGRLETSCQSLYVTQNLTLGKQLGGFPANKGIAVVRHQNR